MQHNCHERRSSMSGPMILSPQAWSALVPPATKIVSHKAAWEYLGRNFVETPHQKVVAQMDEVGADGWELVSAQWGEGGVLSCIFKRSI